MSDQPKITQCPFCGGECRIEEFACWEPEGAGFAIVHGCGYSSEKHQSLAEAIAAHNKFAGAVERVGRYEKKLNMLQSMQRQMRDPERTIVCDILANGQFLPDPDGKRYGKTYDAVLAERDAALAREAAALADNAGLVKIIKEANEFIASFAHINAPHAYHVILCTGFDSVAEKIRVMAHSTDPHPGSSILAENERLRAEVERLEKLVNDNDATDTNLRELLSSEIDDVTAERDQLRAKLEIANHEHRSDLDTIGKLLDEAGQLRAQLDAAERDHKAAIDYQVKITERKIIERDEARAQLAAERERAGKMEKALEKFIDASKPVDVNVEFVWPKHKTLDGKSFYLGGECSKHGRFYDHCCGCQDDYKKAREVAESKAIRDQREKIKAAEESARAAIAQDGQPECRICHGKGTIWSMPDESNDPCWNCNGTGIEPNAQDGKGEGE